MNYDHDNHDDGPRMPIGDDSNLTPAVTAEIMRSIAKTLLDKANQLDPVAYQEPPRPTKRTAASDVYSF